MSGLATASVPAPSGPLSRDCLLQQPSLHIYVPTVEDALIELSCHVRFRASSGTRNRILPHRSLILANGEPWMDWGRGSQPSVSRMDRNQDTAPRLASSIAEAMYFRWLPITKFKISDPIQRNSYWSHW